eukprot:403358142
MNETTASKANSLDKRRVRHQTPAQDNQHQEIQNKNDHSNQRHTQDKRFQNTQDIKKSPNHYFDENAQENQISHAQNHQITNYQQNLNSNHQKDQDITLQKQSKNLDGNFQAQIQQEIDMFKNELSLNDTSLNLRQLSDRGDKYTSPRYQNVKTNSQPIHKKFISDPDAIQEESFNGRGGLNIREDNLNDREGQEDLIMQQELNRNHDELADISPITQTNGGTGEFNY